MKTIEDIRADNVVKRVKEAAAYLRAFEDLAAIATTDEQRRNLTNRSAYWRGRLGQVQQCTGKAVA